MNPHDALSSEPAAQPKTGKKISRSGKIAIMLIFCALIFFVSTFLPWFAAPTDPECFENPTLLSGWSGGQGEGASLLLIKLDPGWQPTGLWAVALALILVLCAAGIILERRPHLVFRIAAMLASVGGLLVAIKVMLPTSKTVNGYLQLGYTTEFAYGAWLLTAISAVAALLCMALLIDFKPE